MAQVVYYSELVKHKRFRQKHKIGRSQSEVVPYLGALVHSVFPLDYLGMDSYSAHITKPS